MTDKKHDDYPQFAQIMIAIWGMGLIPSFLFMFFSLSAAAILLMVVVFVGMVAGLLLGSIGYEPPPLRWLKIKK